LVDEVSRRRRHGDAVVPAIAGAHGNHAPLEIDSWSVLALERQTPNCSSERCTNPFRQFAARPNAGNTRKRVKCRMRSERLANPSLNESVQLADLL
jgi:hypothetical protein